jgi:hypothetical protein
MTRVPANVSRIARLSLALSAALLVAGCTSVPVMGPGPPPLVAPKAIKTLGPAPLKGETATFALAAVTGVPADLNYALQASLAKYAATRNLAILPEDDPAAVYRVKGYLSAVGDSSGTVLVYTWDVTDAFNTPLYRVSGQETGAGSSTDPWLGVDKGIIDAAARETIDRLADWVKG